LENARAAERTAAEGMRRDVVECRAGSGRTVRVSAAM
jgi:hypothetical protein